MSIALLIALSLATESLPQPTRAEVFAYNLDPGKTQCSRGRDADGKLCANAEAPVTVTGKPLVKLVELLRSGASYDTSSAARCFDPHHFVVFYYETSAIDTYDVCLKCHNTLPGGTQVPCSGTECADRGTQTFKDGAFKQLEKILKGTKVKGLTAKAERG